MIKNIFTNFSSRFGVAVFNFIMLLMITHQLGKDIYGQISIIALNISIIHLISDLASGPSLVYLTPRAKLSSLLFNGSTWSIFNAVGIGSLLVYTGIFPKAYSVELLVIGVLISLHSLNQNLLLGQQKIKAYNLLFLMQGALQLLTMFLCIFFYKLSTDVYPYIYACIISNSIAYIVGLILVHKNRPPQQIEESKSILFLLFKNGFFTQAASLFLVFSKTISFNSLQTNLPNGTGAIGIFNSAFSLGATLMLFGASVSSIVLAKVANEKNHTATRATVFRLSKLSFAITLLGVGFFLLVPANFYSWLLGKDFLPVKNIFISMAPGILFLSLGTVFSHYFSGAGKHYMNFICGGITLLVTYLTTDVLIRKYGIAGAGLSTSVTFITLTFCIFIAFVFSDGNKKGDWKQLFPSKADFITLQEKFKFKNKV